jgi:hypothetical protein
MGDDVGESRAAVDRGDAGEVAEVGIGGQDRRRDRLLRQGVTDRQPGLSGISCAGWAVEHV